MFKKMLMLESMQFVVVVVSLFELKQSTNALSHLMLANKRVREFVPFAARDNLRFMKSTSRR